MDSALIPLAVAFSLTGVFVVVSFILPTVKGAPWVPSSGGAVREMLRLARVRPGEEVYDLGSGDGRIVIISAKEFGARSTGIEIDPFRAFYSKLMIKISGLGGKARIIRSSFFDVDLSNADVVTMYLMPQTNERLRPKLEKELKATCRVVSHVFTFDWKLLDRDETAKVYVYKPSTKGVASPEHPV